MLARKELSSHYLTWNTNWGAPFGRPSRLARTIGRVSYSRSLRMHGPFAMQSNSDTRTFEYPWAYFATPLEPGMRVLEVGGGLSGFQFVLSKERLIVENVDPGEHAAGKGWPCNASMMAYYNRVFKTDVVLHNCTLPEAGLECNRYDRVFSISAIEHFREEEIAGTIEYVYKCLKPGGYFILTTDLFLDLKPFSNLSSNKYGSNIELGKALSSTDFTFVAGNKSELYGFPEFNAVSVMEKLPELIIGSSYPVLVQTVVLQKPKS